MERDKVIELGVNAGIFENDGCGVFVSSGDVGEMLAFAALVEKETLERAAKVCDALHEDAKSEFTLSNKPENREFWHGAKDQMLTAGCEIRKLKDNP